MLPGICRAGTGRVAPLTPRRNGPDAPPAHPRTLIGIARIATARGQARTRGAMSSQCRDRRQSPKRNKTLCCSIRSAQPTSLAFVHEGSIPESRAHRSTSSISERPTQHGRTSVQGQRLGRGAPVQRRSRRLQAKIGNGPIRIDLPLQVNKGPSGRRPSFAIHIGELETESRFSTANRSTKTLNELAIRPGSLRDALPADWTSPLPAPLR